LAYLTIYLHNWGRLLFILFLKIFTVEKFQINYTWMEI